MNQSNFRFIDVQPEKFLHDESFGVDYKRKFSCSSVFKISSTDFKSQQVRIAVYLWKDIANVFYPWSFQVFWFLSYRHRSRVKKAGSRFYSTHLLQGNSFPLKINFLGCCCELLGVVILLDIWIFLKVQSFAADFCFDLQSLYELFVADLCASATLILTFFLGRIKSLKHA